MSGLIRKNPEHLKVCHIWLEILCLILFFIHIIQFALFSSEDLPIAGKIYTTRNNVKY